MNHKRKRPKNRRSGCLMCKPHKMNGFCLLHRQKFSDTRRMQAASFKCEG